MTEQDPEEPRENPSTEAPPVNPFEVPLHAITADAKRDVFTQRWFLLTAVVGTLSRAVAWGLILFVTLDYMPVALNKLSGESTVQSRGTLATIAWLERMQEHRISLWICWVSRWRSISSFATGKMRSEHHGDCGHGISSRSGRPCLSFSPFSWCCS